MTGYVIRRLLWLAPVLFFVTLITFVLTHLLPNSLGPVIVAVTFVVPQAIFAEAALSFIGIGVTPPSRPGSVIAAGSRMFTVCIQMKR